MNYYESLVTLNVDIGHLAGSYLRDAMENALEGMLRDGEEVGVELISGSQLVVRLSLGRELGEMEEAELREALQAACDGAVDRANGEAIEIGDFSETAPRVGVGPAM